MKKIALIVLCFFLLLPTSFAFAKGTFSFITVQGADIAGSVKITNPELLGYFAFANFSLGPLKDTPQNPGTGYEVIRSNIDSVSKRVQDFDHLHYYPDSGYVYFDGLINGYSEYDGKWYQAAPEIEILFHTALAKHTRNMFGMAGIVIIVLILFCFIYFRTKQKTCFPYTLWNQFVSLDH